MSADLPSPIDGAQEYLAAIHDRLGETNTLLARLLDRDSGPAPPPGKVEFREPEVAATPPPRQPRTTTRRKPVKGA
jgi:hypothetical protein